MSILSMTKILLKNLWQGPATVPYPLAKKPAFPHTRGRVEIDIGACIYCGICQRSCPTGAIAVDRAVKAWSIDRGGCIQCGYCTEGCPKKCLHMISDRAEPEVVRKRDEFTNA